MIKLSHFSNNFFPSPFSFFASFFFLSPFPFSLTIIVCHFHYSSANASDSKQRQMMNHNFSSPKFETREKKSHFYFILFFVRLSSYFVFSHLLNLFGKFCCLFGHDSNCSFVCVTELQATKWLKACVCACTRIRLIYELWDMFVVHFCVFPTATETPDWIEKKERDFSIVHSTLDTQRHLCSRFQLYRICVSCACLHTQKHVENVYPNFFFPRCARFIGNNSHKYE